MSTILDFGDVTDDIYTLSPAQALMELDRLLLKLTIPLWAAERASVQARYAVLRAILVRELVLT